MTAATPIVGTVPETSLAHPEAAPGALVNATICRTCQRRHASRTASSTSSTGTRHSGRRFGGPHSRRRPGAAPHLPLRLPAPSRPGRTTRPRARITSAPSGIGRGTAQLAQARGGSHGSASSSAKWHRWARRKVATRSAVDPVILETLLDTRKPRPSPRSRRRRPSATSCPSGSVGHAVLAPDERLVVGMLGGIGAHVREDRVGPVRGRVPMPRVRGVVRAAKDRG
jgi:hypothetical protein